MSTPLDNAISIYFRSIDENKVTLTDAFKAGWDARNADVYSNYRIEMDRMISFKKR